MDDFWFPAKRYGWGWGPPTKWQGWAALGLFIVLAAAGAWFIKPHYSWDVYFLYMAVLAVALLVVCWLKGEPPRWRWGDKN